ncbi:MAG: crossover junction endodeoxyribonuclease RuvC [Nitrospiraceae bacterium]|nr:crossover junction endodeoxyribonuclease RuvC [Nitrospiraceae bacterium]
MKHQEKNKSKIILGIDPGSISCGYGLITANTASKRYLNQYSYIGSGRIVFSPAQHLHSRLKELFYSITEIIREYNPDEAAIEKVFFAKSVKSALALGQARGSVLIAAVSCGLPIYEYSALEVKKAVTGYGRAEKHQVQVMVSKILDIKSKLSTDSADALAIALCHTNTFKLNRT